MNYVTREHPPPPLESATWITLLQVDVLFGIFDMMGGTGRWGGGTNIPFRLKLALIPPWTPQFETLRSTVVITHPTLSATPYHYEALLSADITI